MTTRTCSYCPEAATAEARPASKVAAATVDPIRACPGHLSDAQGDARTKFGTYEFGRLERARVPTPARPAIDPQQVGGGKVGRRHPETSRKAAGMLRTGSQHEALLNVVVGEGPVTVAAATPEVNRRLNRRVGVNDVSRNHVSTRMAELRDKGLVTEYRRDGTVQTAETGGGREGVLWVVTEAGKAEWHALLDAWK